MASRSRILPGKSFSGTFGFLAGFSRNPPVVAARNAYPWVRCRLRFEVTMTCVPTGTDQAYGIADGNRRFLAIRLPSFPMW
jgi:hypothetical protein